MYVLFEHKRGHYLIVTVHDPRKISSPAPHVGEKVWTRQDGVLNPQLPYKRILMRFFFLELLQCILPGGAWLGLFLPTADVSTE